MLYLWASPSNHKEPWYISLENWRDIASRLDSQNVWHDFGRKPHIKIKNPQYKFSHWKGKLINKFMLIFLI